MSGRRGGSTPPTAPARGSTPRRRRAAGAARLPGGGAERGALPPWRQLRHRGRTMRRRLPRVAEASRNPHPQPLSRRERGAWTQQGGGRAGPPQALLPLYLWERGSGGEGSSPPSPGTNHEAPAASRAPSRPDHRWGTASDAVGTAVIATRSGGSAPHSCASAALRTDERPVLAHPGSGAPPPTPPPEDSPSPGSPLQSRDSVADATSPLNFAVVPPASATTTTTSRPIMTHPVCFRPSDPRWSDWPAARHTAADPGVLQGTGHETSHRDRALPEVRGPEDRVDHDRLAGA
jgi:hypothetical protein